MENTLKLSTGEWGYNSFMLLIDMPNIYTAPIDDNYIPKRGKYIHQINLFKKHGIYKTYITRDHMIHVKRGTEFLYITNKFTIEKYNKLKLNNGR